jgi:hypothetical protein
MDELENALAWFKAAPRTLYKTAEDKLAGTAEWVWVVIQGDFAEEQSTAQVITGTVVSMIPLVDQICDVRDVVANCKKINKDASNTWSWVALALTLIGLFPTLGSLAKGGLKILFAHGRKATFKLGTQAVSSDYFKLLTPYLEVGIKKFNEFLATPPVRKLMASMKLDNPYKWFAEQARALMGKISTSALLAAFDEVIKALGKLTDMVKKYGTAAMNTQVGQLLQLVKKVRDGANAQLAKVLKPVQDTVDRIARRLEVEADNTYRAYTNAINPHAFQRPTLDAEIAVFKADRPKWVDVVREEKFPEIKEVPSIPAGYPKVNAVDGPLNEAYRTFHDMAPKEIPPGTTLYRVLDPGSKDNSICWMSKAEFEKLKSKDDWRRNFAVWSYWNKNGEFATYHVPPGQPLKVWEGTTASQVLRDGAGNIVSAGGGKKFILEGGARQIVLNPADLKKEHLGKRRPTNWGYDNLGSSTEMVGVPTLTTFWHESKK